MEPVRSAEHHPTDQVTPRRVLVVDDNRDAATALAMLLRMSGHETTTAHDGGSALEAALEFRPDVVLLDLGLPVKDGYEVCRALRREPWGQQIVIVALTGWGQAEDRLRSAQAGFDHHLVKPVANDAISGLLASQPARAAAAALD